MLCKYSVSLALALLFSCSRSPASYFPTKQLCCFLSFSLLYMGPFLHPENKGPSVFPAPQNRVTFQQLPKSSAVISKYAAEIVNGKPCRCIEHSCSRKAGDATNQDILEDLEKQLWNSKSLYSALQLQRWIILTSVFQSCRAP